jgi:hypothetical protein
MENNGWHDEQSAHTFGWRAIVSTRASHQLGRAAPMEQLVEKHLIIECACECWSKDWWLKGYKR